MTTLNDRPNTALLVIDVQRDVVEKAHDRDGVVANINTLLDKARSAEAPVIWVQHSDDQLEVGTPGWEYVPELQRFEATDLEDLLAERKVGHLVVSGASTDACIRSTLHGALVRGYDATLVEDAHTTEDPSEWGLPLNAKQVIAHTNAYWGYEASPGRKGGTVPTAEVEFAART
jgi:nicotinamidase-related amidase